MTADQGGAKSERSSATSSGKAASRKRVCRFLYVLGSGFEPTSNLKSLVAGFQQSGDGLDFRKAEVVVGAVDQWPDGDKSAFKSSVVQFVSQHCEASKTEFDERRVLIRDYVGEDGKQYAVAGYFPTSRTKTTNAAQSSRSTTDDATTDDAADDDGDADDVASEDTGPSVGQKLLAFVKKVPPKKIAIGAGAVVVLVLLALVVPTLISNGGNDTDVSSSDDAEEDESGTDTGDEKFKLPAPVFATGTLRVYTNEPGLELLIDGEVVRDLEGNPVTTPCEIVAAAGSHTITAYGEGYFDLSRTIDIEADGEITLSPSENALGSASDAATSPHRNAEVGVPIPLATINTRRPEFDPFVTPDGLSIWFVGDRDDGRGIFNASRISTSHNFENVTLVARSSDLPATPGVTDDALQIVYAVPEKARLMSLNRDSPLGEFTGKEPLRFSRSLQPAWLSAQILGDGLRLYWVEKTSEGTRSLTSKRDDSIEPFGKTFKTTLPGLHPCLSQDGLRHYTFKDGVLTRFRRTSVTKAFVEDAVIATLELPGYRPSEQHRQFFVSKDEQWLFYCDDPVNGGDLFMVRIFDGAQWGVRPRGKSIPPKVEVAAVDSVKPDATEEMIIPEQAPPKPVDPRSLPLPYTSHWSIFNALVTGRQYEQAEGLLRNASANPELNAFTEQLQWDAADLAAIRAFWKHLDEFLTKLPKGEMLRMGTTRMDFVEFTNGEIAGTRSGNEIRRKLIELSPTDLNSLVDSAADKDDVESQYRFAVLLAYDRNAIDRARDQRFERAPELAARFRERVARRSLVQAQAELDRSNFGEGVRFLRETISLAEGTAVATEAKALEERLYDFVKWTPRGSRQWVIDGNSYQATLDRANGSLLVSEKEYGNFELSFEYKTDAETTAQGGVYFRYPGNGPLTDSAFKIQLANDRGIAADPYCTGSLFGAEAPSENAAKAAGEWNTLTIVTDGIKVTATVNGVKVLDAVAAVDPAIPKRGFVCLDGGPGGITYRKMLLSDRPD
jgi:hypothetical protein